MNQSNAHVGPDGYTRPPSRLYLPKQETVPETVLAHLIARFPHVSAEVWRKRVALGAVWADEGGVITEATPYRHGTTVCYLREVAAEPPPPAEETVLYRDDQILVADKPHGMVVTPSGDHVERSLLVRLQRTTAMRTLVPVHRLDRDTAGLVMFSVKPETRPHYHGLFADRRIDREYLAAARLARNPGRSRWYVQNRIRAGEPWFRQEVVEGNPNAATEIELVDRCVDLGVFRIRPHSGKKHQIRLHMASIGLPILGDPIYGTAAGLPLQLIAHRLTFLDPIHRTRRNFISNRELDCLSLAAH